MSNRITICVILACLALATGCEEPATPGSLPTQAEVTVDEAADAEEEEAMAEVASISQSVIVGTVTDLRTGQPAPGVVVVVDGHGATYTDDQGRYQATGLAAAEYAVSVGLDGQGRAAQGPVFVVVDGQNSLTLDLAYYSQVELPPAVPPPHLPPNGAAPGPVPLVSAALGLALTLLGGALRLWNTRRAKIR